jgi:hypothetical protein
MKLPWRHVQMKMKFEKPKLKSVCKFCIYYLRLDFCDRKCTHPVNIREENNYVTGSVGNTYEDCCNLNDKGQCQNFIGRTEFVWNLETD